MTKICLEQKGQRFTHFLTKHGEPFKLQKVGSAARRVTHFVQSPFCNGRVSLLAGPTFLRRHFTRFPLNKNSCLKFRKNHVPSERYVPVKETKPKPPRVWLSCLHVSRIQIIGPRENNLSNGRV